MTPELQTAYDLAIAADAIYGATIRATLGAHVTRWDVNSLDHEQHPAILAAYQDKQRAFTAWERLYRLADGRS